MRTVACLCCGVTWQAEHSRGPLLCAPCYMSMGYVIGGSYAVTCRTHFKTMDVRDVCPPATMTNGPYVPLLARTRG